MLPVIKKLTFSFVKTYLLTCIINKGKSKTGLVLVRRKRERKERMEGGREEEEGREREREEGREGRRENEDYRQ